MTFLKVAGCELLLVATASAGVACDDGSTAGCDGDAAGCDGDAGGSASVGGSSGEARAGADGTGGLPSGCEALTTVEALTIEATTTQAEVDALVRCVERVEGQLELDQVSAATVEFPVLRYAGSLRIQGGRGLTSVSFPVLTELGGDMTIRSTKTLATVELPVLEEIANHRSPRGPDVPEGVSVGSNDALSSFALPSLTEVGMLHFGHNPKLESVSMSSLAVVTGQYFTEACSIFEAGISFWDNPALTAIDLSGLVEVQWGMFAVRELGALQMLSLPALTSVGTHFWVGENDVLTSLNAPVLASAIYLYIHDNPMLPSNTVSVLEAQVGLTCQGYPFSCDSEELCTGNLP